MVLREIDKLVLFLVFPSNTGKLKEIKEALDSKFTIYHISVDVKYHFAIPCRALRRADYPERNGMLRISRSLTGR